MPARECLGFPEPVEVLCTLAVRFGPLFKGRHVRLERATTGRTGKLSRTTSSGRPLGRDPQLDAASLDLIVLGQMCDSARLRKSSSVVRGRQHGERKVWRPNVRGGKSQGPVGHLLRIGDGTSSNAYSRCSGMKDGNLPYAKESESSHLDDDRPSIKEGSVRTRDYQGCEWEQVLPGTRESGNA